MQSIVLAAPQAERAPGRPKPVRAPSGGSSAYSTSGGQT